MRTEPTYAYKYLDAAGSPCTGGTGIWHLPHEVHCQTCDPEKKGLAVAMIVEDWPLYHERFLRAEERQALLHKAEGYRQAVADYAPLLEAARTTLTRLRVAYRPAFEDDAAVREEPQHSIQLLLEAALAATGAISQ